MKKRLLLVLLATLVAAAMAMTSCSALPGVGSSEPEEPMTLEKFVGDDPEVQQSIEDAINDVNVLVEISGNDIIYSFDLTTVEGYTEEIAKSEIVSEALVSILEDESAYATYGSVAKDLEDQTQIQGIRCIVNYTWGDEVLATHTYTSADAPADAAEESGD